MAWPDLVITIVLALGALGGFRRGFIGELTGAIALGAGIVAAFVYSGNLDRFVEGATKLGPGSAHVVGMFAFALIAYGLVLAIGLVLSTVAKLPGINLVNGLGGAGVGLIKSILFVWLAIYVSLFFPLSDDLRADLHKSFLVSLIASPNENVDGRMRDGLPWYVRPFASPLFDRHRV